MITHLHNRSNYSLLESTISLNDIISFAKNTNNKFAILTDHNTMYKYYDFIKLCKKNNLIPILGLEIDIKVDDTLKSILVLAKSNIGFSNLIKLSSYINTNHMLDEISFKQFNDGLITIIYGENGHIEQYYNQREILESKLIEYKNIFNDYYFAISNNESKYYRDINRLIKNICIKNNINTVFINKNYYYKKQDVKLYKIVKGIKENKTINDNSLIVSPNNYMKNEEYLLNYYDIDDLEMTNTIANLCNYEIIFNKGQLPVLDVNVSSKDYLINLCKKGLVKRLNNNINDLYIKRLNYELEIILKMHFEDYFLIVFDIVRFAKKNNIYIGPGRGSACGSLVSYCLGITHIDPIKYNLLFERFLNIERISMPDIDLDIPDNARSTILEYLNNKFDHNHFCHIITFQTLKAKQAIRDVSRVLNIPLSKVNMISKTISNNNTLTLLELYETNNNFKRLIDSEDITYEMYHICLALEGLPKNNSLHASGVIITKDNIINSIPIISINDKFNCTQFTMEYLEELGLIKFDLLGLTALSIISSICKQIDNFDIYKININDQKTFNLLSQGDTLGIFQLESNGMRNLLKSLKPKDFKEVTACLALYRPGPMQNINTYIDNRNNSNNIEYIHKDLMPILKDTYNVIVYQEQIMQISSLMANFSLSKADILRKAMSKKNAELLISLKSEFIDGCCQNNYSKELANNIYDLILHFAEYGFNKSHAIAYGLVSYQLAFLKANYPLYFYQSLFDSCIGNSKKTTEYMFECHNIIKINYLNINLSNDHYIINNNSLVMPLTVIKSISSNISLSIINNRLESGIFIDYLDFIVRAYLINLTNDNIINLIDSGCLDVFNISRSCMKESLDSFLEYAYLVIDKDNNSFNTILDVIPKPQYVKAYDNDFINGTNEYNSLGFYLSFNPLNKIRDKYKINYEPIIKLGNSFTYIKGIGKIVNIKPYKTKNNDMMAFIDCIDNTAKISLVVMPWLYSVNKDFLLVNNYIIFEGQNDKVDSCLVKKIILINELGEQYG